MALPIPFILTADPVKFREDFAITYLTTVYIFQVAEKLHQRANKKEPDKYDFMNLASRVEEFTLRFLDPLNYDAQNRKRFFNNPETSDLVNTAIKFEQKKVILQNRVICSRISYLWQFTDNLYRPFINRENGANTDLYYMASCLGDRKQVQNALFDRNLAWFKKKKVFIGHENKSTDKG